MILVFSFFLRYTAQRSDVNLVPIIFPLPHILHPQWFVPIPISSSSLEERIILALAWASCQDLDNLEEVSATVTVMGKDVDSATGAVEASATFLGVKRGWR